MRENIGEIDSMVVKDVVNFLHPLNPGAVYNGTVERTGWKIDFVTPYEIQGRVEIKADAWKKYNCGIGRRDIGFNATRIRKVFSTMKKGEIAEIEIDDYCIIGRWKDLNLTWTHLLEETTDKSEDYLLPEDLVYTVDISLSKHHIKSIKMHLAAIEKEIERWDPWNGVVLEYENKQLKIFVYRIENRYQNGTWTPAVEVRSVIELSRFDVHKGRTETIAMYPLKTFKRILGNVKNGYLKLAFGNETPLQVDFEIRKGIHIEAHLMPANLTEKVRRKIIDHLNGETIINVERTGTKSGKE